jgi:O-antigen ligase
LAAAPEAAMRPVDLSGKGARLRTLLAALCPFLIFFTESTFRARKFTSAAPSIDAQIMIQLLFWGLAGLLGLLCGGLSPRNLKGPTAICAVFLFLMVASVSYSPVPKLTAVSSLGYCAFFVFAVALQRNWSERKILNALAVGLSLIVLSAPLLFFAHKEPAETVVAGSNAGRIHGLAEHAAGLGALAGLLVIVSVSRLRSGELIRNKRWLWRLIAIGALGVLGLAFAKTAILALCVSGLLMWWRRSTTVMALAPVWLLLAVATAAAAAIYGVHALMPDWLAHALSRGGGSGHDVETLTGRLEIWKDAIHRIERSPLIGYGFDTGRYEIFDRFAKFSALHTHDMYLQCLLYLGVFGFVFLLIMIGYLIVGFARRPLLWRDWIGFYLLLWGIAEQGPLTNLPSVFTLCWFLVMAALRPADAAGGETRARSLVPGET